MTELHERDVEYRRDGEARFLAHVYTPPGAGTFPALLDVHGGAWSGGNRFSDARIDRALAALGVVVIAIDFRVAPADPYPAMVEDVNYATRWIKAHASELHVHAGRVGAIGSSSGGHMAVLSAVRPHDARYSALPLAGGERNGEGDGAGTVVATLDYVIACWPPIDPYARYLFAKETNRPDLVRNTEGCFGSKERMLEASPTRIVEAGEAQALPPVLVVQGTADANIPMPMIERFAAAYRTAGGACELAVFEGEPHGFASREGPAAERALDRMRDFLRQQLPGAVG